MRLIVELRAPRIGLWDPAVAGSAHRDVETHVIVSKWGLQTLLYETGYSLEQFAAGRRVASAGDQGAAISSGSFVTEGMVVAPCSMRTLAAIAQAPATI